VANLHIARKISKGYRSMRVAVLFSIVLSSFQGVRLACFDQKDIPDTFYVNFSMNLDELQLMLNRNFHAIPTNKRKM